jgi:hypothetical protein
LWNATCTYTGAAVASGAPGAVADFDFVTATGSPSPDYFSSEVFGDGSSDLSLNNQVVGLVGSKSVSPTPEPATAGPCVAFMLATALVAFARRKCEAARFTLSSR